MNGKRGVNNNNENKLLYDPNQRRLKRLGAFSMEENIEDTEEENEDLLDNDEELSDLDQNSEIQNNLDAENDIDQSQRNTSGVDKVAKDAVSAATKNTVKQAGKAAGAAAKKVTAQVFAKLIAFIAANPWVLAVAGAAFLIIFLIIILGGGSSSSGDGYYNPKCNFNESTVILTTCGTEETTNLSLEEYVYGVTYALVGDNNYSSDVIKAIMIVVKTNALSYGGYSSTTKELLLDDCTTPFATEIPEDMQRSYENHYEDIEEYLYISTSFTSTIASLNVASALELDSDIINSMVEHSGTYEFILNDIYNSNDDADNQDNLEEPEEDNIEEEVAEVRETIYIGDSRTNQMRIYGIIDDAHTVYGGGLGYNWFIGNGSFSSSVTNFPSGGIYGANSIMNDNQSYNIVIWLGINDYLYNANTNTMAETYYNEYYELATGEWANHDINIIEVGPVDESKTRLRNADIDSFNTRLAQLINSSGLGNLHYIDIDYNIVTYDSEGTHYGSTDYQNIYNEIQEEIGVVLSSEKHLYKLGDYCEFLVFTDNDYLWWPIGSREPTRGNIYGGDPTVASVSSYFSIRTIQGVTKMHKGIDISATCNDNVVIAAKSGTVTKVYNGCDNNGYYGNECGNGFGNQVYITHEDGMVTVYAHLYPDTITVSVGDTVEQGEKLGMVGNSGSSTGCHLHFQIEVNGEPVDPLEYVDPENPRPQSIPTSTSNVSRLIFRGSENDPKNAVCESLLASGFSENAVIGIMINIQAESGFIPNNLENSKLPGFSDASYTAAVDNGTYSRNSFVYDSAGYGIIQWTHSSRKSKLFDYAKSNNYSIGSLKMQLEYLLIELQSDESEIFINTYKYITGNHSATEISNYWCDFFERPSGSTSCNQGGVCPSNNCSNRTQQNISAMTQYVKNGCQ